MTSNQLAGKLREATAKIPSPVDLAGWALGVALVIGPVAAFSKAVIYPMDPITMPLPLAMQSSPQHAAKEIDARELDCLANNIYYESRNQSDLGMLAVGLVTLTRVESERWSDTVCGVVYEHKQFTWTWDERQDQDTPKQGADRLRYLQSLHLASRILYGDFDNLKDLFVADHYHTTKVRPKWARKMERLAVIDDHVFYVDQ